MPTSNTLRIGIGPRDYTSFRAFQHVPVPGATQVRVPYFPLRWLGGKIRPLSPFGQSVGAFLPIGRVDLMHSYNAILLNETPWIVTFECQFPRVWDAPRFSSYLLSRAASAACRRVIAMSENARVHLVNRNRRDPSLPAVLEKTTVIPPSLEDYPEYLRARLARKTSSSFHAVFVGNDFFRKGGAFAVEAFERLRSHVPIRLTVVSSMSERNDSYRIEPGSVARWRDRMAEAGVAHLQNLPLKEVRALLASADVVLLPTLEDSFGFSLLEAMATGVAVIATTIEAIPEIVENGCTGILLDVPVNAEGRLQWSETVGWKIVDQLTTALDLLARNPGRARDMGMRGRERYERVFHPDVVGRRLARVYTEAVEGEIA